MDPPLPARAGTVAQPAQGQIRHIRPYHHTAQLSVLLRHQRVRFYSLLAPLGYDGDRD